jgi:hypothetical protein
VPKRGSLLKRDDAFCAKRLKRLAASWSDIAITFESAVFLLHPIKKMPLLQKFSPAMK